MAQMSSSSSGSSNASSGEEEEITAPAPITTTTPKPRNPDSSDEEEDDLSESASEDDKTTPPQLQIQPPSKQTAATKPSDSDSGTAHDSESDSESDSDQPPRVADPSANPISSRPLPPAAPSLKEPEGEQENGDGKKRQLFQRIWSEEDEIAVLRGLIAYRAKKGHLPSSSDMDRFQQSIEKDIHINATKNQLVKKIRRLKDKFIKPSTRAKSGLCYDLSKEIWGGNSSTPGDLGTGKRKKLPSDCEALPSASKRLKHEEIAAADVINVETPSTYPFLREAMFKMGSAYVGGLVVARREMELIDDAEAAKLEKQYEKLRVLELKHRAEEMTILNETVKLVLDG